MSQTLHGTPILLTTENRVRSNYCRGMIFCMIVNHCEKVLLNSFLSFKDQGLKLRVFHQDDNFGIPTYSLILTLGVSEA